MGAGGEVVLRLVIPTSSSYHIQLGDQQIAEKKIIINTVLSKVHEQPTLPFETGTTHGVWSVRANLGTEAYYSLIAQ